MKESTIYGILDDSDPIVPKQKIKRTKMPKGSDDIPLDNVVQVDTKVLKSILRKVDQASKHIASDLLANEIPVLMSYDNATAYVETVMRDGLNIDIEIDDDITHALAQLNKLSVIYQYSRMITLPKGVRKIFVEGLAAAMVPEVIADMKKASTGRKYSQQLRELTAQVSSTRKKTDESPEAETVSKIAIRKSRKSE